MTMALGRKVITLYVDVASTSARELAERVAASFRARGYGIGTWKGQHAIAHLASEGVRGEEGALFITVGGDGTLLRAARVATESDAPLLGINTGRLGFLTELDEGDPRIERLPELIEQLEIDERIALEAEYNERTFFALNDVVVRKGGVSRIVPFGLSLNSEHIADVLPFRGRIDHLTARRRIRHRAAPAAYALLAPLDRAGERADSSELQLRSRARAFGVRWRRARGDRARHERNDQT
jgi:ATP-NAD kinase N-terminal domain